MDLFDELNNRNSPHKFSKKEIEEGRLNIWIDELSPCLIESKIGEIKRTIAFEVAKRSDLKGFNSKNGWYINWSKFAKEINVYALTLMDSPEIQGLVAVRNDTLAKASYIQWACVAPCNNKHDYGRQEYIS